MSIFYVGGYGEESLHVCEGQEVIDILPVKNASYLCFSKDRSRLYAVSETENGGVAAFAVEDDGGLAYINDGLTGGDHPCHLSISPNGKLLYVANYSSGSTTIFTLESATGGIGECITVVDHQGFGAPSNTVPERQLRSHAHYVQSFGDHILVCDLGLDAVLKLGVKGALIDKNDLPPGFGPRHLVLRPGKKTPIYVLGELESAVMPLGGMPVSLGVPKGTTISAAIRVSPDSRYLLASNRIGSADGSISVLMLRENGAIAEGSEKVFSSGGRCPRDFVFDPTGSKVYVANQDSNRVDILNWNDGDLDHSGLSFEVTNPTCVLF